MLGVAASNYFYYVAIQKTSVAIAIIRAIHRAGLGVALRGCSPTTEDLRTEDCRRRGRYRGYRTDHRNDRREVASPLSRFLRLARGVAGFVLIRVLQRWRDTASWRVYDRWRVLIWTLASASVFWLFCESPMEGSHRALRAGAMGLLFVFSMISVLGSFSLYFLGLQYLEPTRAIIASCLEPVFSIVLAAALLGEACAPCKPWESCWCSRRS